jgi:carbonic anhydrase/acetyltransferase-like protein (isoleucine patch superfamily)
MQARKYKLVNPDGNPFVWSVWQETGAKVYRLKALVNIPEHGVKEGDLGGRVTSKFTLSQEGICWIDFHAEVLGNVSVSEDAFIGGTARVICNAADCNIEISGKAKISGRSKVTLTTPHGAEGQALNSVITGNTKISDSASVSNVGYMDGDLDIYASATLHGVKQVTGHVLIGGDAYLDNDCVIAGNTRMTHNAVVESGAIVTDCRLYGEAVVYSDEDIKNETRGELPGAKKKKVADTFEEATASTLKDLWGRATSKNPKKALRFTPEEMKLIEESKKFAEERFGLAKEQAALTSPSASTPVSQSDLETADAVVLLGEINAKYGAYETDIVKIIKYPAMTDHTYDTTAEMQMALGKANRLALNPAHAGFVGAVEAAEKAFLKAESFALKTASTMLSVTDKKKVDRVDDLLAIASNDASTEHEKKVAFQQAFKHLEGIIVVPEVAVETFKAKIGLKELEMAK